MPTRRVQFTGGECYHLYNRGTERREVFIRQGDYQRFLYLLFACNDRQPLHNTHRAQFLGAAGVQRERRSYIDLLCFCLMPNHFHLLVRQREDDGGVAHFMQKLGTAYTMYFNTKYERTGALFQGTYKATHVSTDEYLLPLSRYIHLNPLDLFESDWKEQGIARPQAARAFIVEYLWSSYADYVSLPRYPSLLTTDLLQQVFRIPQAYQAYVESWSAAALGTISRLTLERVS